MTSKELKKRLFLKPNSHNLYVFLELEIEEIIKQLEILEILKSSLMLIENKQITFGYGKYHLAIRPDVILSDETIQILKEWLNKDQFKKDIEEI